MQPNPYVGPRSFQPNETLYGRDRETRELLGLLVAERIVLLHSPSGAGKTSLIQAALLPRLVKRDFAVRPVIRVNTEPPLPGVNRYLLSVMLSLEEALPAGEQIPLEELAGLSLDTYLSRRPVPEDKDGEVLIFDQFEEVLTIDPTDEQGKHAFFHQLGEALTKRTRWALFSMRDDYVGPLEPYVRPVPQRFNVTFRLGLLSVEAARQAIQQPARQAGAIFEDDAATKLAEDLGSMMVPQPSGSLERKIGPVEPVQLQVVCRRLWGRRFGAQEPGALPADERRISAADVADLGNVSEALAGYYADEVAEAAGATGLDERTLREWFDRKLITPQGIRGQALRGQSETEGLPNNALEPLVDAYLVRSERRRGLVWYELAHDRLVAPVRDDNARWFEEHLSALQRQADLWERQSRPAGLRFAGAELAEAERWAAANAARLTEIERAFLAECVAAREQAAREAEQLARERRDAERIKRLLRVSVGAGVFVLILALLAGWQFLVASENAVRAESQRGTAEANDRIAQQQRGTAEANRATAEANGRIAEQERENALRSARESRARELAASSLSVIASDPELSVMLGLEALRVTEASGERIAEAEDVLQQAIQLSRIRSRISLDFTADYLLVLGDTPLVAVGGQSPEVQVIDSASGELAFTLPGHAESVRQMAYSPGSGQIATLDNAGTARLWEGGTGAPLPATFAHSGATRVALSPAGDLLATGSTDGSALIWRIAGGDPISITHSRGVDWLAFSPDGGLLGTVIRDREVRLWDTATGEPRGSLGTAPGTLFTLAFSPDGRLVAASGAGGVILVWRLDDQTVPPLQLRGHSSSVFALAFSADSRLLVSSSADSTARIWDATTAASLLTLGLHRDQVRQAAFSADGATVVTTSRDRDVRFWSLGLWQPSLALSVAVSPRGDLLLSGGVGGTLYAWRADGTIRARLSEHANDINSIVFSQDGGLAVSGDSDGRLVVWSMPDLRPTQAVTIATTINEVAISPDSRWLAASGGQGQLVLWDRNADPPRPRALTGLADANVWGVAFSPDGQQLAASTATGVVAIWDVAGGAEPRLRLDPGEGEAQQLRDVAFHPSEGYLAFSRDDGSIQLWNPQSGERWAIESAHSAAVVSLAFSADGGRLVSSGRDNTIRLWGMADRALLASYSQPVTSFEVIFWEAGGRQQLLAAGADGIIRQIPTDLTDLRGLARERVTRGFSQLECTKYRLEEGCPAP